MAAGKKKKHHHEVSPSKSVGRDDDMDDDVNNNEDLDSNDDEMMEDNEENNEEDDEAPAEEKVYMPGEKMEDGEELTFDKSAYVMYHAAQTGAPCLSFDIIQDDLGDNRNEFPMTLYMTCGTQTSGKPNSLMVMKMTDLSKLDQDEDSDSEESYIEEEEEGPKLQTSSIKHIGGVNRIRHTKINQEPFAATWSETGSVHIWNIKKSLESLDQPGVAQHQTSDGTKSYFSFSGHQTEGFAMDWSVTVPGRLATGSCNRNIHLWQLRESTWHVDQRPLNAHEGSVEDLQWSPNENNVFASCSVDKTVRIWDARGSGAKACMITCNAHDADVNVISWNRNDPFILSGGDDGVIKVWDLRQIKSNTPVAKFKQHSAPVTSIEWHPTDSTVFAASGDDDQITIWDLAVERDNEMTELNTGNLNELPPQLLFIHMGQTHIKELHWHKQLPGVLISTAETGFNVFKTISV